MTLHLAEGMSPAEEQEHRSYLVARMVGNAFLPEIRRRLEELNVQHFQKAIGKVRLRNNTSNWGSCSYDGNISISTRLLFAPGPPSIMYSFMSWRTCWNTTIQIASGNRWNGPCPTIANTRSGWIRTIICVNSEREKVSLWSEAISTGTFAPLHPGALRLKRKKWKVEAITSGETACWRKMRQAE